MYHKEQGHVLFDVVLAVAIIAVAVAGILYGILNLTHTTDYSADSRTATRLARSQMEYIKAQAFEDIGSLYGLQIDDAEDVVEPHIVAHHPDKDYAIDVAITLVPGRESDLQKVTVTVDCDGRSVRLYGYTLASGLTE